MNTDRIATTKRAVQQETWAEMYAAYQASGKTVREWCSEQGIVTKTFYYPPRKLREVALDQAGSHQIVPIATNLETPSVYETASIKNTGQRNNHRAFRKYLCGNDHSNFAMSEVMLKVMRFPQMYLVCGYTDMRRPIDGLAGIVKRNFGLEPCSVSLFLFCSRAA